MKLQIIRLQITCISTWMCANKWLMLNCYCYIAILETILLGGNKWLIVNRMIRIRYQYSKTFNWVPKNCYLQNVFSNPIYLIYMYKEDLALNNLQWLICHKTQTNQIMYIWYICIKRIWHWITYNGWYAIKPKPTKSYIFNIYV